MLVTLRDVDRPRARRRRASPTTRVFVGDETSRRRGSAASATAAARRCSSTRAASSRARTASRIEDYLRGVLPHETRQARARDARGRQGAGRRGAHVHAVVRRAARGRGLRPLRLGRGPGLWRHRRASRRSPTAPCARPQGVVALYARLVHPRELLLDVRRRDRERRGHLARPAVPVAAPGRGRQRQRSRGARTRRTSAGSSARRGAEALANLNQYGPAQSGQSPPSGGWRTLKNIRVASRSPSGRVRELVFETGQGDVSVMADKTRWVLQPPEVRGRGHPALEPVQGRGQEGQARPRRRGHHLGRRQRARRRHVPGGRAVAGARGPRLRGDPALVLHGHRSRPAVSTASRRSSRCSRCIAASTGAGIAHALGASALLHALGLEDHVGDWDVNTEADHDVLGPLVRGPRAGALRLLGHPRGFQDPALSGERRADRPDGDRRGGPRSCASRRCRAASGRACRSAAPRRGR